MKCLVNHSSPLKTTAFSNDIFSEKCVSAKTVDMDVMRRT